MAGHLHEAATGPGAASGLGQGLGGRRREARRRLAPAEGLTVDTQIGAAAAEELVATVATVKA